MCCSLQRGGRSTLTLRANLLHTKGSSLRIQGLVNEKRLAKSCLASTPSPERKRLPPMIGPTDQRPSAAPVIDSGRDHLVVPIVLVFPRTRPRIMPLPRLRDGGHKRTDRQFLERLAGRTHGALTAAGL